MNCSRSCCAILVLLLMEAGELDAGKVVVNQCVPPLPGLVSWWPADGDPRDVLGANHGTLENGATFAPSVVGQAFDLDGTDDFVQVLDSPSLSFAGSFSIHAWINLRSYGSEFSPIVSKWNDLRSRNRGYFLVVRPAGAVRFDVSTNGLFAGENSAIVSSMATVPLNTLTHVAAVFDSDAQTLKVFVNGVESASMDAAFSTAFDQDEPLLIGAGDLGGNARDFTDGLIDEVELFNRALTAEEIQAIFTAGIAGKCRPDPPPLRIRAMPEGLSFSFVQQAQAATQRLFISSAGSDPSTFQVDVSTQSGEPWLSVSPLGGEVTPTAPVALDVTADPTGLPAGTYLGETIISSPANGAAETTCRTCHVAPISMAITSREQLLQLSQKGLPFTAVSRGGAAPAQSFRVLNAGFGTLSWDISTSTLSGGDWLSVRPTSGTSDAVMSPAVQVTVDHTGLEPGAYYGVVEVTAPEAASSPEFLTAVLNLLPTESNPGPLVIPTGLVFSSSVGRLAQALAQQIQIFNLTSTPLSFTSSVSTSDGADWFGLSPSEGTVVSSQPTTIDFGVDPVGLAPGIYRGATTFSFDDDSTRTVNLVLAVAPTGRLTLKASQRRQNGCVRSEVAPVFQLLGGTAPIPAGWPAVIEVAVVDDCGDPMAAGSAVVDFTNISSPSLALASSGDGLWTATWNVPSVEQQSMAGVTVTVTDPGGISASLTQAVSVAPNPTPAPSVNQGGIVHGASFVQDPLGPGTIVSIFGQNLSTEPISAGQAALGLPLPTELAGTEISLGGRRLPLLFSREDQVNAIVPFELTDRLNESLPLLVRRTDAQSVSVSEPVFVMAARPGVFTQSQSGIGPGAIQNVDFQTVTQANPVKAGDAIVIYCAGLGEVDPPVASGTAAPGSPLAETAEQVTVTIAGLPAQVLFAGLTPSFASLYQVNAVVPQGVAQGEVEVTVSIAGQTSSLVTVAVE